MDMPQANARASGLDSVCANDTVAEDPEIGYAKAGYSNERKANGQTLSLRFQLTMECERVQRCPTAFSECARVKAPTHEHA